MDLRALLIIFLHCLYSVARRQSTDSIIVNSNLSNATKCFDSTNKPKLCHPPFLSVLHGRRVNSTSTCGTTGRVEFCVDSSVSKRYGKGYCDTCNQNDESKRHPPAYLTDYNDDDRPTWWQSESLMDADLKTSKFQVNLTVDLGNQMQVTYVKLAFESPRPYSMAIYRKVWRNSSWEPWAFFSRSCLSEYSQTPDPPLSPSNQELRLKAICTAKHSHILPLSEENIIFPLLKDRIRREPDAFWKDEGLQKWVLATQIRVTLDRINSFGDIGLGFHSRRFRKYFYAISDFAVGCRCNCNGHASECIPINNAAASGSSDIEYGCSCEHNTEGRNCEKCRRGYYDRPWRRATPENAYPCIKCQCNGNSEDCVFNEMLYVKSGNKSGGQCVNCRYNTEGPHCEKCIANHHPKFKGSNICIPCNCHPEGSTDTQCDLQGKCTCRPGVSGDKCDRCLAGYYNLTSTGCVACGCERPGTINSTGSCDMNTGACQCKQNVFGQRCDTCRPQHFGLRADDPLGCQPCFCYGRSSVCTARQRLWRKTVFTDFNSDDLDGWLLDAYNNQGRYSAEYVPKLTTFTLRPKLGNNSQNIKYLSVGNQLPPVGMDTLYFSAPAKYLGNKATSFNQFLTLDVGIPEALNRADLGAFDIELVSGQTRYSARLDAQQNLVSSASGTVRLRYRLTYARRYGWQPRDTSVDAFRLVLSQLTGLWVRAVYRSAPREVKLKLYRVSLDTTTDKQETVGGSPLSPANNMHTCTCPQEYAGHMCETCAPGYTRKFPNSGPFGECVKCVCHGNADHCDPENGHCMTKDGGIPGRFGAKKKCKYNTIGRRCHRCKPGYYGNATSGSQDACKPCNCPNNSPCDLLPGTNETLCYKCPKGYEGAKCDYCQDGYWGVGFGRPNNDKFPCKKCECSNNTDPNDVRVCDRTSGKCLKCAYNTGGRRCERCKKGYFGNANAYPRANCTSCGCYLPGTDLQSICSESDGTCMCKRNVVGQKCDRCIPGSYNVSSGSGCLDCDCNGMGSEGAKCNYESGQCKCKMGVTGRKCDKCQPNFFNFTKNGCLPCNCHPDGSQHFQCDNNGQCPCKMSVQGKRCDMCVENRQNIRANCSKECPPCYGVIQQYVNQLRRQIQNTLNMLAIGVGANDTTLQNKVRAVAQQVTDLFQKAQNLVGSDPTATMAMKLKKLKVTLDDLLRRITQAGTNLKNAKTYLKDDWTANTKRLQKVLESLKGQIQQLQESAARSQTSLDNAKKLAETMREQNSRLETIKEETGTVARNLEDEAMRLTSEAEQLAKNTNAVFSNYTAIQPKVDKIIGKVGQLQGRLEQVGIDAISARNNVASAMKRAKSVEANATAMVVDMNTLLDKVKVLRMNSNKDLETLKTVRNRTSSLSNRLGELTKSLEQSRALQNAMSKANKTYEDVIMEHAKCNETYQNVKRWRREMEGMRKNATKFMRAANETLQKLRNFEATMKSSQKRAEDARDRAANVSRELQTLEDVMPGEKTRLRTAKDNMGFALDEAKITKNKAAEVDNSTKSKLQESESGIVSTGNYSKRLKKLSAELDRLLSDADSFLNGYNETQNKLDQLMELSSRDLTNVTLEEAELNKTAVEMRKNMDEMTLNNREPTDAELNKMAQQMTLLEKKGSNLSSNLTVSKDKVDVLKKLANEIFQSLASLKKEHTRIVKIAKNLPTNWLKPEFTPQ